MLVKMAILELFLVLASPYVAAAFGWSNGGWSTDPATPK